jgi:iron complex transport system ATP-binding protein
MAARAVRFRFGDRAVVEDVSLRLEAGRLLVVLGPNGAGKTTLLRLLAGLLRPAYGEILLADEPLAGRSRREIARAIAVVPQELVVPFPFSVREMVAMGRAPHLGVLGREGETDRAATDAALAELGLRELAQRSYPTLSGGERQRVLLARAVVQAADILLLDEPTAHMDLGYRLHTFEWLLRWLRAQPARAAALVTHDLSLAGRFADEILLLEDGRVAALGAPRVVLTAERIERVYGVEAIVESDAEGRVRVSPLRSRFGERFGYSPGPP